MNTKQNLHALHEKRHVIWRRHCDRHHRRTINQPYRFLLPSADIADACVEPSYARCSLMPAKRMMRLNVSSCSGEVRGELVLDAAHPAARRGASVQRGAA
jgi:hypothetical protein